MLNTVSILMDTKAVLSGLWRLCAAAVGVALVVLAVPTASAESAKKDFYCFVVDKSGSIKSRGWTQIVKGAMVQFSGRLEDDAAEVEVICFNDKAKWNDSDYWWRGVVNRKNIADFYSWFDKNYAPDGCTRLYDTVAEAIKRAIPQADKYNKVTVLVISDGMDSCHTPNEKKYGSQKHTGWESVCRLADELKTTNPNSVCVIDSLGYDIPPEFRPRPPFIINYVSDVGKYKLAPPPPPLPPKAEFECWPAAVQVSQAVSIRLVSDQNVKAIHWDFGDGTASAELQPKHVYASEGAKTVKVVVTGTGGQIVSNMIPNAVRVEKQVPLKADFDWLPAAPHEGDRLGFRDKSLGVIESWTWEVKGAGTFTGRDPEVPALKAGDYDTALTVVGKEGKTATSAKRIHVAPPVPLKADFFVASKEEICVGESVTFVDRSSGSPSEWSWTVDGRSFSKEQNPVAFKADKPGKVAILLDVTHKDGRTDSKQQEVSVLPPPPNAAFKVSTERLIVGQSVSLESVAPQSGEDHVWLVNGKPLEENSTRATISWVPARSGKHTLTHRVKNTVKTTEFPKDVYVNDALHAGFGVQTPTNGWRSGNAISFVDASKGEIEKRGWSFGDGGTSAEKNPVHTYETAARREYVVTLAVTGPDGTKAITNMISILPQPPAADFALSENRLIVGKAVSMKAVQANPEAVHTWIDGGKTFDTGRGKSETVWTLTSSGAHTLVHIVSGAGGEQKAEKTVVVEQALSAAFEIVTPQEEWRSGNAISFVDKSTGVVVKRQWSFGDGNISDKDTPTHKYDALSATNYTVTLTVTGPDGTQTATRSLKIDVGLQAAFEVDRISGQLPLRDKPFIVKTKNLTKAGELTFSWDFGDGEKSSEREPEHGYRAEGEYLITLVVRDNATGLTRAAPPVRITVLPNTQIWDTLVWMGILAILVVFGWVVWFFRRPPWTKKTYRLTDEEYRVCQKRFAVRVRKGEIAFPFAPGFSGNEFASLRRVGNDEPETELNWSLVAGQDGINLNGESRLAWVRASVTTSFQEVGETVSLRNGDTLCFGELRYRFDEGADAPAKLTRITIGLRPILWLAGIASFLLALALVFLTYLHSIKL